MKLRSRDPWPLKVQRPSLVSLGPHVHGAAYPRPDTSDSFCQLAGQLSRTAAEVPRFDERLSASLRQHTEDMCNGKYPSLTPGGALSHGDHLGMMEPEEYVRRNRSWTRGQKEKIIRIFRETVPEMWAGNKTDTAQQMRETWLRILAFAKPESYPSWKQLRGINGRDELAKVLLGPVFRYMENEVYEKWGMHVKHMSFKQRAELIFKDHSPFIYHFSFDASAFESSFNMPLLMATEYIVYRRLVGHRIADLIFWVCYQENAIHHKTFKLYWNAKRASGDMQTAFGNWLVNVLVQSHLLITLGHKQFALKCEGDDNIMSTILCRFPTTEEYARYGFVAKILISPNLSDHSFCGCVYGEEGDIVTDPRKAMLNFGWADAKYDGCSENKRRSLLVSKALSYAYQYPNCPIIRPWCDKMFGLLGDARADLDLVFSRSDPRRSYFPKFSIRDFLQEHPRKITVSSRYAIERMWGVTVPQQIAAEAMIEEKEDLLPIPLFFDPEPEWLDFWEEATSVGEHLIQPGPDPSLICSFVNWAGSDHHRGRVRVTDWKNMVCEVDGEQHDICWSLLDDKDRNPAHDLAVLRQRGKI